MEIEVLRIGQRIVRDDRVTTHVALVARSFGAQKIYMNEVNPEIKHTISNINKTWGGDFEIEIISDVKRFRFSMLIASSRYGSTIAKFTAPCIVPATNPETSTIAIK